MEEGLRRWTCKSMAGAGEPQCEEDEEDADAASLAEDREHGAGHRPTGGLGTTRQGPRD